MPRLWFRAFAALLLLAVVPAARAQVAVLTLRSLEEGLADGESLAPLVLGETHSRKVSAALKLLAVPQALAGIDRKQPLGIYLAWPSKWDDLVSLDVPLVGFLPVTAEKPFLDLLDKLRCRPQPAEGGLYRLAPPDLPPLFLRFAHGHAFAALRADLLRGELPPPARLFSPETRKHTLALRIDTDRFPRDYPQLLDGLIAGPVADLLHRANAWFEEELLPQLGEEWPVKEFQDTIKQVIPHAFKEAAVGLVNQIRAVDLTLDCRRGGGHLDLDLTVVPRDDQGLKAVCQYLGQARSRFSPLGWNADLALFVHFPVAERARDKGATNPEEIRKNLAQFPLPPQWRQTLTTVVEIGRATLLTDGLDLCWVLLSSEEGQAVTDIQGLKVQNGRKLDHCIRDALKNLPTAQKKDYRLRLNVDRQGGARVHRLHVAGDKTDTYLVIREDVVWLASGDRGLKAVREALDRFGQTTPPPSPVFQMELAAAPLLASDWLADEAHREAVEKVIPRADWSKVRSQVSVRGGDTLHLHLGCDARFLRVLAILGESLDKEP